MSVWVSVWGLCVCVCVSSVCVRGTGASEWQVFHQNDAILRSLQLSVRVCVCVNLDRANQSNKMEEAGKNTSKRIAIIRTHKKKLLAFIFKVIALFVQGNNNILETLPLPSLSLQGSQNH